MSTFDRTSTGPAGDDTIRDDDAAARTYRAYGADADTGGTRARSTLGRDPQGRSVMDLFSTLVDQMSFLFRKEVELAKAEVSQKASRIGGGVAKMAIGGVLMIPALVILLEAAVAWLAVAGLEPQWGALIVGLVVAAIGGILLYTGLNAAKAANLAPRRTVHQLQRDVAVAKEQVT